MLLSVPFQKKKKPAVCYHYVQKYMKYVENYLKEENKPALIVEMQIEFLS